MTEVVSHRKVGFLLGVGIFLIPIFFAWLLLRKDHSTFTRVVGLGWLAPFLFTISGLDHTSKTPIAPMQVASSSAQQKTDAPKPASAADKLTSDAEAIKQIEQRIKDNRERLKKYYATSEQVNKGTVDVLLLSVTKELYSKGKSKEEKELSQKAAKLLPQAKLQVRELYASSVEEIFVKNGMDVRVSATGKDKSQLRIIYALMSQPLVYKFQNEIMLDEQAKTFGFSTLVYTNGFESSLGKTWTINLK